VLGEMCRYCCDAEAFAVHVHGTTLETCDAIASLLPQLWHCARWREDEHTGWSLGLCSYGPYCLPFDRPLELAHVFPGWLEVHRYRCTQPGQ
jgi:hypothetical protein